MTLDEQRAQVSKPLIRKLTQLFRGLEVYQVLGDRVLVETVEPITFADEVEKEHGIILTKTAKRELTPLPCTGIVLKLGDGCEKRSIWRPWIRPPLKAGSMVLFHRYAGSDFTVDDAEGEGLKVRVLDTKEVLCTMRRIEAKPLDELVSVEMVEGA